MPRFGVTDHAIDRYLARVGGDITRAQIVESIQANGPFARLLKKKTWDGALCYELPNTELTLVCRRDAGATELVVVTILSTTETADKSPIPEDELEILREAEEDRKRWNDELSVRGQREADERRAQVSRASEVPAPPPAPVPPLWRGTAADWEKVEALRVEKSRLKTERMKLAIQTEREEHRDIIRQVCIWLSEKRKTDVEADAVASALEELHPWTFMESFLTSKRAGT